MTPHRPSRTVIALAVALLALAGCGLQPSARVVRPVGPALSGSTHADAPLQIAAPVALGALEVRAANLGFEQRELNVAVPGDYLVRFVNNDGIRHEVRFDDGTVIAANPGESAAAIVSLPAEGSAFLCVIPAHRDAGMVGQIAVGDSQ